MVKRAGHGFSAAHLGMRIGILRSVPSGVVPPRNSPPLQHPRWSRWGRPAVPSPSTVVVAPSTFVEYNGYCNTPLATTHRSGLNNQLCKPRHTRRLRQVPRTNGTREISAGVQSAEPWPAQQSCSAPATGDRRPFETASESCPERSLLSFPPLAPPSPASSQLLSFPSALCNTLHSSIHIPPPVPDPAPISPWSTVCALFK